MRKEKFFNVCRREILGELRGVIFNLNKTRLLPVTPKLDRARSRLPFTEKKLLVLYLENTPSTNFKILNSLMSWLSNAINKC